MPGTESGFRSVHSLLPSAAGWVSVRQLSGALPTLNRAIANPGGCSSEKDPEGALTHPSSAPESFVR